MQSPVSLATQYIVCVKKMVSILGSVGQACQDYREIMNYRLAKHWMVFNHMYTSNLCFY